jgi:hypothetical protein
MRDSLECEGLPSLFKTEIPNEERSRRFKPQHFGITLKSEGKPSHSKDSKTLTTSPHPRFSARMGVLKDWAVSPFPVLPDITIPEVR